VGFTRKSALQLLPFLGLIALGLGLWRAHATAWDLGRRSPVLSFDAAQYAVAARELAENGRLATDFALPIELARHPSPPWPLAAVQPGLLLAEAAVFRALPPGASLPGLGPVREPRQREWLTLFMPFWSFLLLGGFLALAAAWLLERHAKGLDAPLRAAAGFVVGAAFLLDPEAQHLAVGGLTELPFTLGLTVALWAIAMGWASRRPLLFGVMLGVAGAFRGSILGLLPWLVLAAALEPASVSGGRRGRVAALVLIGFVLPLLPWWIYKLRAFGAPWDLSWYGLWDGAGGHSWFSLSHLPAEPRLPRGSEALGMLAPKLSRNLGELVPALFSGLRILWIGALALWLAVARPPRALAVAGGAVLAVTAASLLTAALGASWLRYLFPARVPLEAAGLLASWGLIAAAPKAALAPRARLLLCAGLAAIVIAWGARQSRLGLADARAASAERGLPSVETMVALADHVGSRADSGEVVMSNLGPSLAWYARRPVLHLALTPGDVEACRARVPFRQVLLVFRDPSKAWPGWREVVASPEAAMAHPGWDVRTEGHWVTPDGFQVVWLELGEAAGSSRPPGGP
jgi:hypothetical protein